MAHNPLELFDRLSTDEKVLYLDHAFKLESPSRIVLRKSSPNNKSKGRPLPEEHIRQGYLMREQGVALQDIADEFGVGMPRSWSRIFNRIDKEYDGDIDAFMADRRENLSRNNKDALLDPVESFIAKTERELNL